MDRFDCQETSPPAPNLCVLDVRLSLPACSVRREEPRAAGAHTFLWRGFFLTCTTKRLRVTAVRKRAHPSSAELIPPGKRA